MGQHNLKNIKVYINFIYDLENAYDTKQYRIVFYKRW